MAKHSSILSSLENPIGREAWQGTIHGVATSGTQFSDRVHRQAKWEHEIKYFCLLPSGPFFFFWLAWSQLPHLGSSIFIVACRIFSFSLETSHDRKEQNDIYSRILLNPGIEPASPALQADCLPPEPPGKPKLLENTVKSCRFNGLFLAQKLKMANGVKALGFIQETNK